MPRLREPVLIDQKLLAFATPTEQEQYRKLLELEKALSSPLSYALFVTPTAQAYKHLILLNEYLVALFEGRLYASGPGPEPIGFGDEARHPITGEKPVDRLAISMPPRHGKSYLVSEHLPAWFLSVFPEFRFILVSYEADFAATWGRKARNIIEAHPEFGIETDNTSRAADLWNLKGHRGGMKTAGAAGPITGEGGHVMLIDDPIKNSQDAQSKVIRDGIKDWWPSTFESRREPYPITGRLAPIILMATRWHEDDPTGWQMETEGEKWCYLNLPALAFDGEELEIEGPDPLGRAPGEALCPQRYTRIQLLEKKEAGDETGSGEAWFNALYQGKPSTEGSGIFKRPNFLYYRAERSGPETYYHMTHRDGSTERIAARDCFRFQTVDLAASTKTSADWTVFSTWDVTHNRDLILVDRYRERMESADHSTAARAQFDKYRPKFIGVEKQTYGLTLIQNLLREGKPVRKLDADTDKTSRAIPAGDLVDNGKVFFPKAAEWIKTWEDELVKFPNSTHDDQVDTFSYAALQLTRMPAYRSSRPAEANTIEAKVERFMKEKDGKRRRRSRHPMLGRM